MSRTSRLHPDGKRAARIASGTARVALLALLVCVASSVHAQTCDAPLLPRAEPVLSTTCGGDLSITSICNGEVEIQGPSEIWRLAIGTGATGTVALSQPDWTLTPVAYLLDAGTTCGDGDCRARVDPMNPLQLENVQPGSYYLLVTGSEWNAPGSCGIYQLTITGNLGDFDLVFADGFD